MRKISCSASFPFASCTRRGTSGLERSWAAVWDRRRQWQCRKASCWSWGGRITKNIWRILRQRERSISFPTCWFMFVQRSYRKFCRNWGAYSTLPRSWASIKGKASSRKDSSATIYTSWWAEKRWSRRTWRSRSRRSTWAIKIRASLWRKWGWICTNSSRIPSLVKYNRFFPSKTGSLPIKPSLITQSSSSLTPAPSSRLYLSQLLMREK